MRTNDTPVRLRRTCPYRALIDELQRHARHIELFLWHREYDIAILRVKAESAVSCPDPQGVLINRAT